MDMQKWLEEVRQSPVKKPMPVLSFPAVQLLKISVPDLISSSRNQGLGMKAIADRTPALAAVSMMDLSVEAEMFGAEVRFSDDEVPTVVKGLVNSLADAEALEVPSLNQGRGGIYVEAAQNACNLIKDRPVFAGVIGPFSLAGRLADVSKIMMDCYEQPELVHTLMGKATQFLIDYVKAYRQAGVNGVVIADPLTGILSPALMREFSLPYLQQMIKAIETPDFLVIYHNCGNTFIHLLPDILEIGASVYHIGNATSIEQVLAKVPETTVIMGNIDPAAEFRNGTPETVRTATLNLLNSCGNKSNFVISSGCDIPPLSPWENIDAFFAAVTEYYNQTK